MSAARTADYWAVLRAERMDQQMVATKDARKAVAKGVATAACWDATKAATKAASWENKSVGRKADSKAACSAARLD